MDTTTGSNFFVVKMHFDNFKVAEGVSATKDEFSSSASFLFYPNPLSGSRLYLKSKSELHGNVMTIQITDLQGRIVMHQTIDKSNIEKGIDVNLPGGMYFIQWKTYNKESGVEKLIIVK